MIDPETAKLQKQYKDWLGSHRDRLALISIPAIAKAQWRVDPTNEDRVRGALAIARPGDMGVHSPQSYYQNLMALRGNVWVVDGMQLHYAREQGIIKMLPDISEAQVEDKSKGDAVAKALALAQVLWLVVQLILRARQGLPSTQLEIVTMAFASSSWAMYLLYWKSPQNVRTRFRVPADAYPSVEVMTELGRRGPIGMWFPRSFGIIGNDCVHYMGKRSRNGTKGQTMAGTVVGLIFGAVHFAGWHSHFPTRQEQLCWRLACILLVALPIPICSASFALYDLERTCHRRRAAGLPVGVVVGWIVLIVLYLVYLAARTFIMVEALRTLWYLPAGAYTTTTLREGPHFG